mmetsp:Transcript_32461/g.74717  ORF Transcript_32461/g.74717 Transcript_32461/m.74717 type:complete len:228 (-) Transcript_32461:212-895(-)
MDATPATPPILATSSPFSLTIVRVIFLNLRESLRRDLMRSACLGVDLLHFIFWLEGLVPGVIGAGLVVDSILCFTSGLETISIITSAVASFSSLGSAFGCSLPISSLASVSTIASGSALVSEMTSDPVPKLVSNIVSVSSFESISGSGFVSNSTSTVASIFVSDSDFLSASLSSLAAVFSFVSRSTFVSDKTSDPVSVLVSDIVSGFSFGSISRFNSDVATKSFSYV